LTGLEFEFKHLNGEEIRIKTKNHEIIQHGENKIIRNKGMPFFNAPSSFGNFILRCNIIFPTKNELTADQIEKLKEVKFYF
jgi:DnaJ-class molecular chaperone